MQAYDSIKQHFSKQHFPRPPSSCRTSRPAVSTPAAAGDSTATEAWVFCTLRPRMRLPCTQFR